MSLVTEKPAAPQPLFNVPNQLTTLRLLLSIVLFVFIAFEYYLTSLVLFVIAASTDWLDGYWARKYGQVTNLGRILDPFVDKIIICGTFIFLAAVPGSGIVAWMAVVIVGRELLVTALRSYLEGEGADFSANMAGKLKMVLQCIAAGVSLFLLSYAGTHPTWLDWAVTLSVWGAVLLTLYSGLAYIQRAVQLLRASRYSFFAALAQSLPRDSTMNENAAPLIGGLSLLLLSGSIGAWWLIAWKLWNRQPIIEFSPRLRAPWRGFDVLVLAITYLFSDVLAASVARGLGGEETASFITALLGVQIGTHVAWFAFAVVYLLARGAYLDDLGWDTSRLGEDFRSGLLLFLAAVLPVFGVQWFFTQFLGIPSEHPLLELTKDRPTLWIMVVSTIAAVGVAPWFEEFLFRVVLQGWLESEQVRLRKLRDPEASSVPGFAPLMISSLLFAALHAKAGPDPAAIFILSLFLGYAYRQTHRVFPSWIIHTGINGFTMLNMWILYLYGGVK